MKTPKARSGKTIHTVAEYLYTEEGSGVQIVRVTWDGVSHERRLAPCEPVKLFVFPSSRMKGPKAPDDAKAHKTARRKWLNDDEKGVEGRGNLSPWVYGEFTFTGRSGVYNWWWPVDRP